MHTSKYSLRNKRINITIPPKEYVMGNVHYQLLELMSRFDEELLQNTETFHMNSFVPKNKHILSINMLFIAERKIVMFVHMYTYYSSPLE